MKYIKELLQAAILAALFGGPLFLYMLFVMKP
jgi:ABC-type Fe3+-siderophore transport system permease subunit